MVIFNGYGIYFYAIWEKYLGEFKNDYFDGTFLIWMVL